MSKPIRLTGELLEKIKAEFVETVKSMKMFDGKIKYEKSFRWKDSVDDKAYIVFTPVAFAKMTMLVQGFDSEVAWHGVVDVDPEVPNVFNIVDILVYPQLVDGSNVNTDQAAYTDWLYGLEDGVFERVRMQGHSHVNFSTRPSSVDDSHQESILKQVGDDMFYIFMIWNKKFEHTIRIFDMKNNTLYEDGDIEVLICQDGVDLNAFMKDAKEIVKAKPKQTAAKSSVTQYKTTTSVKTKPKAGQTGVGSEWPGILDDDDPVGSGFRYYGQTYR